MRFIRLHPGAQKGNAANYWSLFEPHYKQNLSANPKRTAKSSFYISDAPHLNFVQIIFPNCVINFFSKNFRQRLTDPTTHRSHGKIVASRDAPISLKNSFAKYSQLFANTGFSLAHLRSSTQSRFSSPELPFYDACDLERFHQFQPD